LKKSFTIGLEKVFSDKSASKSTAKKASGKKKAVSKPKAELPVKEKPSASDDSFKTTLDALFQESFEDQGLDKLFVETKFEKRKKRNVSKKKGFDLLFEPTVDTPQDEPTKKGKRVTFSFEEEKLLVLKEIARKERKFLKDVVSKIVSEYISKYPLGE